MPTKKQIFEGGNAGDTLTLANSGLAGSDAFTGVTIASGHVAQLLTAAAMHGSRGLRIQGNGAGVTFAEYSGQSATTAAWAFYFRFLNGVGTGLQIAQYRQSGGNMFRIGTDGASRLVYQTGTAGSTSATWSTVPTVGTWYRAEGELLSLGSATGSGTFRIYVGDATTPVYNSGTLTGLAFGTNPLSIIRPVGLLSGTTLNPIDFDSFQYNAASTSPIGPFMQPPYDSVWTGSLWVPAKTDDLVLAGGSFR